VDKGCITVSYKFGNGNGGVVVYDDGDIEEEMEKEREAYCALLEMPEVDEGEEDDGDDDEDGEPPSSSDSKKRKSWSREDDEEDDFDDDDDGPPRQRRRSDSVRFIELIYALAANTRLRARRLPHRRLDNGDTTDTTLLTRRALSLPCRIHPRLHSQSNRPHSLCDAGYFE
jgi:hypothetical protein